MKFTDIRTVNWFSLFPNAVHPYLYAMRLDRPVGWWLLLLPAWWSIALAAPHITPWTLTLFFLFFIGAVIMRGAGCIINDLWDRDIDPYVERTAKRPIASGEIGLEDALIFLGILLLCGLAILILMPTTTIILGILSIPLIVTYPLMKRITWWPQAFLGLTFNFGALMGWSAATGGLGFAPFFLYLAGICWTLGYDTIYAHQDIEDDVRIGVKSTALKFGEDSYNWVIGFYAAALVFFIPALVMGGAHWLTWILCLPGLIYMGVKLSDWKPDDKQSSLETFKTNKNAGLLIFAALCVGLFL